MYLKTDTEYNKRNLKVLHRVERQSGRAASVQSPGSSYHLSIKNLCVLCV